MNKAQKLNRSGSRVTAFCAVKCTLSTGCNVISEGRIGKFCIT